GRHGVLIPLRSGPNELYIRWQLGAVAQWALELLTDPVASLGITPHPGSQLEGRAMADMLVVATRQLGDPISRFVLVESGHGPLHAFSLEAALRRPFALQGPRRCADSPSVARSGRAPRSAPLRATFGAR